MTVIINNISVIAALKYFRRRHFSIMASKHIYYNSNKIGPNVILLDN